jgi:hypothetical protein
MNVNFPKKEVIYCDLLCRYEKKCTFVSQKHKKTDEKSFDYFGYRSPLCGWL